MKTVKSCIGVALLMLLATASAEARPGRGVRSRALQELLLDLARIEIGNVEREDPSVERAVQQQIDGARRQLLGAVEGSLPFLAALQMTQRHLGAIAGMNWRNAHYEDPEGLQRMQQRLEEMRQRVEQLMAMAAGWGQQGPPPGWGPPPPGYHPPPMQGPPPGWGPPPPGYGRRPPMAPDRFAQLLAEVRNATFHEAQLNVLRDSVRAGNRFTCQQIVEVMHSLSFDRTKVEAAAILFPQAVDPGNFSALPAALTFESHRQQLRQRLGR